MDSFKIIHARSTFVGYHNTLENVTLHDIHPAPVADVIEGKLKIFVAIVGEVTVSNTLM